jgi:hypothetical protein
LEQQSGPQKRNMGIRSLNKMQEWIIKVTSQFLDELAAEPKGVLSKWSNNCGVLTKENIRSTGLIGVLFQKKRKKLNGN